MLAAPAAAPVAPSKRTSNALLRRFETPPDLISYTCDQPEDVVPLQSAERLSRALGVIPVYARLNERVGETSLTTASSAAACIRTAIQTSLYTTASIRALVPRLVHKLRSLHPSPTSEDIRFVHAEALTLVTLAHKTRDSINGLFASLIRVSNELKEDIINRPSKTDERWKDRLRVGALCAGGPSFATAIISAVYNNTNPQLSQAMAVTSACVGLCATAIPCMLQWYWDRDARPRAERADLVSAHIEMQRMQLPFGILVKWWKRLSYRLQGLATIIDDSKQAAQLYDAIIPRLDQYTNEVATLLKSVEGYEEDELCITQDAARVV